MHMIYNTLADATEIQGNIFFMIVTLTKFSVYTVSGSSGGVVV